MTLAPDLDRDLVALYRGWDRLERGQFGGTVLDFDLAQAGDIQTFDARREVSTELERLRSAVGGEQPEHALVRARLTASLAYLRALEHPDETRPFRQYVFDTMGIEPAPIAEARIRTVESRLRQLLREVNRSDPILFTRKGFDAFRLTFQTQSGVNLRNQFEFFTDKWLAHVTSSIGAPLDASSIAVEFAEEDAYWKNWISGNLAEGEPIKLRINVHERHVWYQGAVETLVLHEYCGHAVQMVLWQDAVRRKAMPSFFGILTVHFPDQYLLEGLAESLAYVVPDSRMKLEKRSESVRELQTYNLLVLNNVHIMANEKGLDAARQYARQRLPFTSEAVIERELHDRTRHPLFRTYQYVYAPAKEAFLSALMSLPPEKRWPILRPLYRTPLTPAGVRKMLEGQS